MPVDDDHLLEAVVGEALQNVEDVLDKVFEVNVHGPGEVHHVVDVAEADRGKHEAVFGRKTSAFGGDGVGAKMVDLEGEMMAVLLDGPGRENGDLAHFHGFVYFGPREFVELVDLSDRRHH